MGVGRRPRAHLQQPAAKLNLLVPLRPRTTKLTYTYDSGGTPGTGVVNDPLFPKQWGLDQINAPEAWARATGQGATIAIVDTGVDLNHPDLKSKLVPGSTLD